MHPTDKAARVAGAVYLSMVFTAPFSLIYVPNKLIVRGETPPRLQATFLLMKRFSGFRSSVILLGRSFSFASPSRSIGC